MRRFTGRLPPQPAGANSKHKLKAYSLMTVRRRQWSLDS